MTETSNKIKKYKAKFDPDVIFLRWKQTGDIAYLKYYRQAIKQAVLDALRETMAETKNMGIVEMGRLFQFSREFEQLKTFEDTLWGIAGLPLEFFDMFKRAVEMGRSIRAFFPSAVQATLSFTCRIPPGITYTLEV